MCEVTNSRKQPENVNGKRSSTDFLEQTNNRLQTYPSWMVSDHQNLRSLILSSPRVHAPFFVYRFSSASMDQDLSINYSRGLQSVAFHIEMHEHAPALRIRMFDDPENGYDDSQYEENFGCHHYQEIKTTKNDDERAALIENYNIDDDVMKS